MIYYFYKFLLGCMSGFGIGFSPKMPGTLGTLVALPIYFYGLSKLNFFMYTGVIIIAFIFGAYGCHICEKRLKKKDPQCLVWDEMVGFWASLCGVSYHPMTMLLGFFLFRLFDIVKPWPICWIDSRVKGGLGVMLDDLVAAIMVNALLHYFTIGG